VRNYGSRTILTDRQQGYEPSAGKYRQYEASEWLMLATYSSVREM